MMRYLKIFALAVTGLMLAVNAWAQIDGVKAYKVGDADVWAVADSISERDLSIFPGLLPQVAEQYVPGGKTASAVMTFVIKLGNETILVDTGLGNQASAMLQGLSSIGIKPADITAVLLTHYHGDHIGGLLSGNGKTFPNAKIYSSQAEQAYWLDYDIMLANPHRKSGFDLARKVFALYEDANQTFAFGNTVLPGIKALNAVGHTPGHTVFLLESNGEKMLFWADLTHAAALQFPRPDISASYDMDPEQARVSRQRFMELAADERLPIAGAHLPFAGVGMVVKNPKGGYIYRPLP